MYPVNKPNQYNKPKVKENPLELKEGSYFWLSRILGTFTKDRFAQMQRTLAELRQKSETLPNTEETTQEN